MRYLPLAPSGCLTEAQVSELEPWADTWELWMFLALLGWEEWVGWIELRIPGVLRPCGGDTALFSGNW